LFVYFEQKAADPSYAYLAVAYVLLFAGWVRVLFVQPPHPIWAGGSQLRGDRRVYNVVLGSALLLIGFLIFPFFQNSFKITLLYSWEHFLIILGAGISWIISLKVIWQVVLQRSDPS
jgi:hypothetical protein